MSAIADTLFFMDTAVWVGYGYAFFKRTDRVGYCIGVCGGILAHAVGTGLKPMTSFLCDFLFYLLKYPWTYI